MQYSTMIFLVVCSAGGLRLRMGGGGSREASKLQGRTPPVMDLPADVLGQVVRRLDFHGTKNLVASCKEMKNEVAPHIRSVRIKGSLELKAELENSRNVKSWVEMEIDNMDLLEEALANEAWNIWSLKTLGWKVPYRADLIAAALRTVTHLDLSSFIMFSHVEDLASQLKENNKLTVLKLRIDHGFRYIADALNVNETLTSLSVSTREWLAGNGYSRLVDVLRKNVTLTHLDLGDTDVLFQTDPLSGPDMLLDALVQNKTLTKLGFETMRPDKTKFIARVLKEKNTLTHLELTGGNLEKEMEHFADALKGNKSLTNLDLTHCDVGYHGLKRLLAALKENNKLTTVNFSHIRFGLWNITPYLVDLLRGNKTLTSLNCTGMQLGLPTLNCTGMQLGLPSLNCAGMQLGRVGKAKPIADALLENNTLTTLILSRNGFYGGAKYFGDALKENKTLTHLDLSNNDIFDSNEGGECERFAEGLSENSTLTHLNLNGSLHRYHEEDVNLHLGDALKKNETLTNLEFDYFSEQTLNALKQRSIKK